MPVKQSDLVMPAVGQVGLSNSCMTTAAPASTKPSSATGVAPYAATENCCELVLCNATKYILLLCPGNGDVRKYGIGPLYVDMHSVMQLVLAVAKSHMQVALQWKQTHVICARLDR